MYAASRIPNVIAVMSGLLLAGGVDAAQAQRHANKRANVERVEGS